MLIRLKEVIEVTGVSKSTIYRWMSEGEFPKQIPLGKRSSAWVKEEVVSWINQRMALRGV